MTQSLRQGGNIYAGAVDAATTIILETGQAPDIAELAQGMAVDEQLIANVFPLGDALIGTIMENALRLLHDLCVRSVVKVDDQNPIAQFEALSDAYIEWAWRYPREFRIIGRMPANEFEAHPNVLRYEVSIHELMLRLLTRAQQQGMLAPNENLHMVIAIAHTYAYGVASKMLLGDLSRWAPGMAAPDVASMSMHALIRKMLTNPVAS